ncbi:MAG: argininosuccinate synthase [Proteobacteria bacterium]|nr:argininosuccinate synthase [Pseudomonadota bacterium]
MTDLSGPNAPSAPVASGGLAVVAFSGGLDTSFVVCWLRREAGARVVTVTVDTGGFDAAELEYIAARSAELGAEEHVFVDGRQMVYDEHLAYLIKGNVLRGAVYPLCVGAERVVQAREVAAVATAREADVVVHGSTGAGNDQVRFEVAMASLAPTVRCWSPIRDWNVRRASSAAYLGEQGFPVDASTKDYSINAGLWGVTIGGKETHDPWGYPPEEAWPTTVDPSSAPPEGDEVVISFADGLPVALDGVAMSALDLVEAVRARAAAQGVGRDIHLGDTILGIKGRIAFEASAAAVLIPAHRELEKLVLSGAQRFHKDQLGDLYGAMLHEARHFDPVMRDIEAFLNSSQRTVTGDVRVFLRQGAVQVRGTRSPFSMLAPELARYGEENALWDGRDAEGFSRIYGTQQLLSGLAARRGEDA